LREGGERQFENRQIFDATWFRVIETQCKVD